MVSKESVLAQLQRIGFNERAWGRAEVRELPNILIPDEEIFECVNGIYEGGFALLVGTDIRVLLIDKKPFKYLTVEDLRFDMINEIDYSHRLMGGAYVSIATGNRDLHFRSYNQPRLRKLIGHVQHCMAEVKKKQVTHQEGQNQHLEQINQRLQSYLMVQHQYQQSLREQLQKARKQGIINGPEPPQPDPELSDYLLAQSLLAGYQQENKQDAPLEDADPPVEPPEPIPDEDLYAAAVQEVFGRPHSLKKTITGHNPFDVNPLRIAYAKLPTALRNKKFSQLHLPAVPKSDESAATQPQAS